MRKSIGFRGKGRGFTLIELMIVIAIIGILSAIAVPAYQRYVINSNRTAIEADLTNLAALMERRYTENGRYTITDESGESCPALTTAPMFNQGPSGRNLKVYNIAFQSCSHSQYTLRATPIASTAQAGNGYLELSSTGLKSWDKNDSGNIESTENTW